MIYRPNIAMALFFIIIGAFSIISAQAQPLSTLEYQVTGQRLQVEPASVAVWPGRTSPRATVASLMRRAPLMEASGRVTVTWLAGTAEVLRIVTLAV